MQHFCNFLNILLICILVSYTHAQTAAAPPTAKVLKCAVCHSLVFELHHEIDKVDKRKKINVGSYRIESDGNQNIATRPYAGSETHMTEVLETFCATFKDYAQGRHKETGKLEVIQIVTKSGAMNPRFSEYDMVPDPELNKGLEYYCQSITEDYEEEILKYFSKIKDDYNIEESQKVFCETETDVCRDVKDEL